MQVEVAWEAPSMTGYSARDLGFLSGRRPDRLFEREISVGRIFNSISRLLLPGPSA